MPRRAQQRPILVGGTLTASKRAEETYQDAQANLPGPTFLISLMPFAALDKPYQNIEFHQTRERFTYSTDSVILSWILTLRNLYCRS